MLPSSSSQSFFGGSGGVGNTFGPVNSGVAQGQPGVNADPNAPEMLDTNVKMALQYIEYISSLTASAINGIEKAFHSDAQLNSQTASADMSSIKQYMDILINHLVQSGVGALPLVPEGIAVVLKDETTLLAETSTSVKELYARKQQLEENNGTVASLLIVPESSSKK